MIGRYDGTAVLNRGESAPVFVTWTAETGSTVAVLGGGTAILYDLRGTVVQSGTAFYQSGLAPWVDVWYSPSTSSLSPGDYELVLQWSGTAVGEPQTRIHRRTVLVTIR